MTVPFAQIFGIRIDLHNYDSIRQLVSDILAHSGAGVISYSHFAVLLDSRRNREIREVLNASECNYVDGIGVLNALRFLYGVNLQRINATELNYSLLRLAEELQARVFFLGGTEDTAINTLDQCAKLNMNFGAVSSHHGMSDISDISVLDRIREFAPDILLVGLGSPKQFEWIRLNKQRINIPVIVVVGGFLEFFSGTKPRAPLWMRKLGLEWLHRLLLEPKRLWKRYLFGIPYFVWLIFAEKIKLLRKEK